ncbi:Zn2+ transporter [Klebsormidium nitens]|uniref:Zn2+ transporter n=1 Tax=Klebsormidium nitens TaxID=105231 RepID=A0A1Y1IF28_KLENI|nr:Zn2+ transporter [Klebsormidium nitens]|eukprot:GAQ87317.1 Zn2+ transporter [Klebsormidium nitens]
MVLGLSLPSRPGDHMPVPHGDMEAGSLPATQAVQQGDCALAGKHVDGWEQHRGAAAPEAEELADLPANSVSDCLLSKDRDDGCDVVERERVWRKLSWAIVLCCLFMGIEVVGGVLSNSLAILTDAAHLLSDVAGFALSLFALWGASWRPTRRHSYGYQRMEILGALASVLMTWAITGFIIVEAITRLLYSAEDVNGRVMFLTATFGVAVNVAMAVLLSEHHSHGLPGQACSHGHDHAHAHAVDSYAGPPSPNKPVRTGYAVLENTEEPTSEKDSFVEMASVVLPAADGIAGQDVAVVVHRHDNHGTEPAADHGVQKALTSAGQACTGHHSEGHRHEHPPSAGPPSSKAGQGDLSSATAEGPAGQHSPHTHSHQHQQHTGCEAGHGTAAHHSHAHPPVQPHSHHHHPHPHSHFHSCGHKEPAKGHGHREAPASAATEAPDCHNCSDADAFTPLFSPLQLLSDAPAYLAGKLDPSFSPSEGPGGAHVHSSGGCKGAHGHTPRKQNINLRGAFVHVVGDLVQSVGVMVAGAIIWARPDWRAVDLACTFLFSTLVVGTTVKMVRDIVEILMEATPHDVDADALEAALQKLDGVRGVHRLHVWALSVGKNALTCHVAAKQGADTRKVLREASELCSSIYKIDHVTIQIES